ncbi:MAG: DNA translocase FtsK [Candidatus Saccharimonadia bacterium]
MAKRKTRKKTTRRTKKTQGTSFSWKPEVSPEVSREILAFVLSAFVILLILAVFGVGGSLPSLLLKELSLGLGYASFLLPIILALLAFMLFLPSQYQVKLNNYLGFIGVLVSLAGLFQLLSSPANSLQTAQAGQLGGYVGYWLTSSMLNVLNAPAAFVILLIVLLICLVTASNVSMMEMLRKIFGLLRRPEAITPAEIQINEPTVNTRLPIKGTIGGEAHAQNAPIAAGEALTMSVDSEWQAPSFELLEETTSKPDAGNVKENAAIIEQTMSSFGIDVVMGEVNVGPTVTQYTFKPPSGVRLTKITGLDHNLALSLAAHPIRIEAPIPGKSAVGIEIPNRSVMTVRLRDIMLTHEYEGLTGPLEFVFGRDVSGQPAFADLAKMPHMLIAGATGSGKSVMINTILISLLYRNSPSDLKMILVDPKRVELSLYNDIPHLLTPVIVEPEKCISALKWAVAEMERRYKLCAEVGKRNIAEYNAAYREEAMPYIIIVIDELADLMALAAQDVEALIVRLAQMARAVGIHLVLATQRPSVDVITGLIKANIPARLAFSVASQVDSRTILDQSGAEKLLGKGDMLFASPEFIKPKRIQGVYIDEKEVKGVTDYLRSARVPQYNDEILAQPVKLGGRSSGGELGEPDDEMFTEAAETVIRSGKASASLLQRRLRVGYARAARLLDLLEERGIVGPADGARPRDVLVASLDEVGSGSDEFID